MVHFFRTFILVLALALAPAVWAEAREPAAIDIVFDVDWTLFSRIADDIVLSEDVRVVTVEGIRYRMSDGVVESLNLLRSFPNVRISVYSGGDAVRNDILLKSIVLDPATGLTARDIMSRVLAFEDLEDLAPNAAKGEVKFRDRYRKNLKKFFDDLARTILIDDMAEFAAEGQKANMLWTGPTFDFFGVFADSKRIANPAGRKMILPTDPLAWALDRLRIPVITAILESAIRDDARAAGRGSFVERVGEKLKIGRVKWFADLLKRVPAFRRLLCAPLFKRRGVI